MAPPVGSDIGAAGDPDALVPAHMVQEARQAACPSGMACHARVEPDIEHLGGGFALLVELVERIREQPEEFVRRLDAARHQLAVIGDQRIGHDQLRVALHTDPVG
jgi:hypothetical protein